MVTVVDNERVDEMLELCAKHNCKSSPILSRDRLHQLDFDHKTISSEDLRLVLKASLAVERVRLSHGGRALGTAHSSTGAEYVVGQVLVWLKRGKSIEELVTEFRGLGCELLSASADVDEESMFVLSVDPKLLDTEKFASTLAAHRSVEDAELNAVMKLD